MTFFEKMQRNFLAGRYSCVGLDPDLEKIPERLRTKSSDLTEIADSVLQFLELIIQSTAPYAGAFKPNWSFFLGLGGSAGLQALETLCGMIRSLAPQALLIVDMKVCDIASSNAGYAKYGFDQLGADVITVQPYLGHEALGPLIQRRDKGIFILCRTSNPGAGEFQNLTITGTHSETHLYERVAERVSTGWNALENCGLVVGATAPQELERIRKVAPGLPLLIPGIGTQGGDLKASVLAASSGDPNAPFVINQSRSILYASKGPDFANAGARVLQETDRRIAEIRSGR